MFHLVKQSTETQGVVFGLCDLRLWKSTPCLLETALLWSALQTSLENFQTPFTKYSHQHAPGMSQLHSPSLTHVGSVEGHIWKAWCFQKSKDLIKDWHKFFWLCQRYVIDSQKEHRHKIFLKHPPSLAAHTLQDAPSWKQTAGLTLVFLSHKNMSNIDKKGKCPSLCCCKTRQNVSKDAAGYLKREKHSSFYPWPFSALQTIF